MAIFDGFCWSSLQDNNNVTYNFTQITVSNDTLYAYTVEGRVFVYDYDSWYEVVNILNVDSCLFPASNSIVVYNNEIFFDCYNKDAIEITVKYNVNTEEAVTVNVNNKKMTGL